MTSTCACPKCSKSVPADAPEGFCPECLMSQGLVGRETLTFIPRPGLGTKPASPALEDLAPFFPQLDILGLIGAGGMGHVYCARQKGLDRLVALKILHEDVGKDAAFTERFEREARALARLNHPHVVGVYESGRAGGYYYLVMEFVDGFTLREMIADQRMPPATALKMLPQICEALDYAHNAGVVHRDIKPENILVDMQGNVKIADFGLAKLSALQPDEATLTQSRQIMGTLHYMAPEQMRGSQEVDYRADIYSLGVVIYEMLTGELPIGRFEPPSRCVAVDVRIDDVVLRALERDPNRRYQSAAHVKTELESICSQQATAIQPVAGAKPASLRRALSPFPRSALGACGLILALSCLPWGSSTPRTKLDVDSQFMMDNGGAAAGESMYLRLGALECAFFPEGTPATAWQSSVGLRLAGEVNGWPLHLPNSFIPVIAIVIAILLVYCQFGRAAPAYLIPILALTGAGLTTAAIATVGYRGHCEPGAYLTLPAFAWCLSQAIWPVAREWSSRALKEI